MYNKKLLEIALLYKEYHCACYIMMDLAAEYLEGDMDSSKELFNKHFRNLPEEVLKLMILDDTFSCITKICQRRLAMLSTRSS